MDRSADGTNYLVIHSGSRNLGKQVAEFYQQLAIDLNHGKEEYFQKRDALIAEYKATGRRTEIQAALKALRWTEKKADVPDELSFLYGTYLEDYLHDVERYVKMKLFLLCFTIAALFADCLFLQSTQQSKTRKQSDKSGFLGC